MKWTHTKHFTYTKQLSHIQTQNSKIVVAAYGVSTLTSAFKFPQPLKGSIGYVFR